jgi:hypothetical protein
VDRSDEEVEDVLLRLFLDASVVIASAFWFVDDEALVVFISSV